MAACYCAEIRTLLCFLLILSIDNLVFVEGEDDNERPHSSGIVHFNNPKLLESLNNEKDKDGIYMFDKSQEAVDPQKMGGIVIQQEASHFAFKLRLLSNEDIGVGAMQAMYDSLPFAEINPDLQVELNKLAEQVSDKFRVYFSLLRTNKMTVENTYLHHIKHIVNYRADCCSFGNLDLRWDEHYNCRISRQLTCDLLPPAVPYLAFNPGRNLTEVFQVNVQYVPSIKWQYFMSTDGIHNEFPAHNFNNMVYADCKNMHDIRHREVYVSTLQPQRKNVVLLVDHGNSLSPNQLITAKAIAKYILLSLSKQDRVGLVALASETTTASIDGCLSKGLVSLTDEAKQYFSSFVDSLKKHSLPTNHSLGFTKSFEMLSQTLTPENNEDDIESALIIYISRGLLSSLTEAKEVLKSIAIGNGRLHNKVIINTYAVFDVGKPIMYEESFLKNVAEQNFDQHLVQSMHPNPIKKGTMRKVNTVRDLGRMVGDFYKVFNESTPDRPHLFLPQRDRLTHEMPSHYTAGQEYQKDKVTQGLLMSLTWPCFGGNQLFGLVGMDIHAGDVVEGITYFTQPSKTTYAFIIDRQGKTLMHPDLERPILADQQPMYTDISHFESYDGFDLVRVLILSHEEGSKHIEVPRHADNTSQLNELHLLPHFLTVKYMWKRIKIDMMGKSPFIVVIKAVEDSFKLRDIKVTQKLRPGQLVYHRLDLLPTDNTCMHLKQLATLDTSALFLSASAFTKPFEHLSQPEDQRLVQAYLAYLNDKTNLISNPGLFKDNIRKDVAAISHINDVWVKQFHHNNINKEYIVRRYVATPSGVFQMYPGTLLNKAYDPTKREWYRRAIEYPGKVTLTAPYLDTGGAGYIVTISHTIYEGKHAALHAPFDRVVAVMGMDMTLGYFYKMIREQIPMCEHPNIRCFIMDDRGYLISHPSLIEANGRGTLEEQHITHKEPLIANDILNHIGFVRKKLCNSYNDRTAQRFYHFNTSLSGVLTNLVHGEHCSRYQVTAITGTNAFFGIVNQTCDMMRAFCPCSVYDRLCLNCHRAEQSECECPCECPLEVDFCTDDLHQGEQNPSCARYTENVELVGVSPQASSTLSQCLHISCSEKTTKRECLGVLDCEWCSLDSDGLSFLKQPFCSTQRVCFAGVLGAATPYHDEVKNIGDDQPLTLHSTPVGPVAGGIMGCFLVLALAVYCYRHHVHRLSHQYINTLPDNQVRMSHLDNDTDDIEPGEEIGSAGHTNIVLATLDNPASISPYRVNTTYRRPAGGDSDHGYSTMTPHEDSEQASTACLEPLIIGRDRYRPSNTNIPKGSGMLPPPPGPSRRSRSPTPPQTVLQTCGSRNTADDDPIVSAQGVITSDNPPGTTIPELQNNCIIANVTVHMVDTH